MLKIPGENTLRALSRLEGNEDWKTVQEWLRACLEAQREANDTQPNEVPLRQGQGAAQALKDLLKHAQEATGRLHAKAKAARP